MRWNVRYRVFQLCNCALHDAHILLRGHTGRGGGDEDSPSWWVGGTVVPTRLALMRLVGLVRHRLVLVLVLIVYRSLCRSLRR